MSYTVWDLETSTRTSYKRKANPFDPENYIVMQGWKVKGGNVQHDYFGRAPKAQDWFTKLLASSKLLVGQNIKFDILYAIREPHNLAAFMRWVADGGMVWDCQLAEYLLNGMGIEDQMLSMDDMAPRYGGNVKFDEVKALWEAGVDTIDIDRNMLTKYLVGQTVRMQNADGSYLDIVEHGDIGNTEVIFLGQYERAKAVGQVKNIMLNCGSLICTTEMERNGMAIDLELGYELAKELEAKLAVFAVELDAFIPQDFPIPFNWGSVVHKSALIFGGQVRYQKWVGHTDEQGNQLYARKKVTGYVLNDGSVTVDEPTAETAARYKVNKNGKNAGEYKTKQVEVPDTDKPKGAQKDHWYTLPGFTKPKKSWEGATEGVYSTAADVLEELTKNTDVPFLKTLGIVTGIRKDLGTYFITTNNKGERVGMLTLVQLDGIIHHMLNHTSTVTGRFSSSNPNLQNIPKGNKSQVKRVFISRWGYDGVIIQSDFSSLEIYIQAILTNCKQLIEDLKAGLDMHCVRVSQKFGITYDKALLLCKGGEVDGVYVDAEKSWDYERTKAKVYSFQRAYGAGKSTIAADTGMAEDDVQAFIDADEARYPEIEPFFAGLTNHLNNNTKPTRVFVQHPDMAGLTCNLGEAFYRTPDNKLYRWRQNPSPKFLLERERITVSYSPPQIKNYPVQGTGGEWAKAAMWIAIRYFYHLENFGGKALLVNQVHDALYADAHKDVADEAAAALEACMVEASTFMEWWYNWELPLSVPSDTTVGPNMMEDGKPNAGHNERVKKHREAIRALYMNGYVASFEKE